MLSFGRAASCLTSAAITSPTGCSSSARSPGLPTTPPRSSTSTLTGPALPLKTRNFGVAIA
jgi:hypothetical protein